MVGDGTHTQEDSKPVVAIASIARSHYRTSEVHGHVLSMGPGVQYKQAVSRIICEHAHFSVMSLFSPVPRSHVYFMSFLFVTWKF